MLPVPDALVGERVDAALARMLGLSRSRCAELAGEGHVLVNGVAAGKSDRLGAMDIIEVTIPEPESKPTPVTDMAILYDDEDIVVVDKPVGVAAHTGPGWEGPTVLGNLEAAGYRITSYGPPERQGIGHFGCDDGRQVRARLHGHEASLQGTYDREGVPRRRGRAPRPGFGHD